MPSFRRREPLTDGDRSADASGHGASVQASVQDAQAVAEVAEAEAAEAEALAAAASAKAKAVRLRQAALAAAAAEAESADEAAEPAADDDEPSADTPADVLDEPEPRASAKRRSAGKVAKWASVGVAIAAILALLTLSGLMIWQHRQAAHQEQLRAEYAAAGRQGAVTLMSLDFTKAQEDVQRIIDNSTGSFRDDFKDTAEDFVKVAQESKVVTDVTVDSAAVESMTKDSAVVLVAATSRVTNTSGAQKQPRTWRLAVDLQRDGDQIKMSKVEFVP